MLKTNPSAQGTCVEVVLAHTCVESIGTQLVYFNDKEKVMQIKKDAL